MRIINTAKDRKLVLDASDYKSLVDLFDNVVFGVLGLRDEEASEGGKAIKTIDGLMQMVLEQRKAARAAKDWATSDRIRDDLKALASRSRIPRKAPSGLWNKRCRGSGPCDSPALQTLQLVSRAVTLCFCTRCRTGKSDSLMFREGYGE